MNLPGGSHHQARLDGLPMRSLGVFSMDWWRGERLISWPPEPWTYVGEWRRLEIRGTGWRGEYDRGVSCQPLRHLKPRRQHGREVSRQLKVVTTWCGVLAEARRCSQRGCLGTGETIRVCRASQLWCSRGGDLPCSSMTRPVRVILTISLSNRATATTTTTPHRPSTKISRLGSRCQRPDSQRFGSGTTKPPKIRLNVSGRSSERSPLPAVLAPASPATAVGLRASQPRRLDAAGLLHHEARSSGRHLETANGFRR